MPEIKFGDHVLAHTATGDVLLGVAVSGVVDGGDFPVVWIATEDDWRDAVRRGERPDASPWPADDVELADEVPA